MNAQALRLLTELIRTPWAMQPEWIAALSAAAVSAAAGGEGEAVTFEQMLAARFSTARAKAAGGGGIAVVPLVGIFTQRGSVFDEMFGGGSIATEKVTGLIRSLGADPAVGGIVLEIDSPGGTVGALDELSTAIFELRGAKPVAAVANYLAASAAYWVGSAADEFIAAPESETGSIGVWTAHVNAGEWYKRLGLDVTLVSAGKYKVEGHPFGPLGEEAKAFLQSQVDEYYGMFVRTVARNRRDTQSAVREGYGEGRTLTAREAVKAKLADRVATLSEVVAGMQAKLGRQAAAPRRAAAERALRIAQAE